MNQCKFMEFMASFVQVAPFKGKLNHLCGIEKLGFMENLHDFGHQLGDNFIFFQIRIFFPASFIYSVGAVNTCLGTTCHRSV